MLEEKTINTILLFQKPLLIHLIFDMNFTDIKFLLMNIQHVKTNTSQKIK